MATQPVALVPYRALVPANGSNTKPVIANAVIEEVHEDESVLTTIPVEVGSTITDHIYNLPAQLTLLYSWSSGPGNQGGGPAFLNSMYQNLLSLKANATLFTVYTGKRTYVNMAIKSLSETTDKTTEYVLSVRIRLQEILMATATIVTLSPMAQQKLPQKTAPILNQGPVQLAPGSSYNPNAGGGS